MEATGNDKQTALMYAAQAGHQKTTRLLILSGANLEVQSPHHKTALMLAAQSGRDTVVECLLREGANPEAQTPQGETALTLATAWNHPDVVKTLANFGKLTEPLKSAALEVAEKGNRTEVAQYLSAF